MRIALAIVATAFLAAAPALAKLPVKPVKIAITHKEYTIDVAYPQTGNKAIDADIAGWAKAEVSQFKSDAAGYDKSESPQPYDLEISFTVARNDDKIFAVELDESTYTGGAHPNGFPTTMNFLMPDGYRIYLPEIFTSAGLKTISTLAIHDLDKQLGGPDSMSDRDWIARGAGPQWDNFAAFTLLPNALDIQYASYNVAAYAAGPQETKIPLSALKDFMREDWHAPVASFDCAAAKTPVEKAICSDVALARLDRDMAETYRGQNQQSADGKTTTNPQRDAQRVFLAKRNVACGAAQPGAAAISCLTALYKGRLAAMKAGP